MAICILDKPDQLQFKSLEEGEIFEPMECHFGPLGERNILELEGHMVADFLYQQYPFHPESSEEGEIFEHVEHVVESMEYGKRSEQTKYMTTNRPIKVESLGKGEAFEREYRMDTSIAENYVPFHIESLEEGEIREERGISGQPIIEVEKHRHTEPKERDIIGQSLNEGDKYSKIRRIGEGGEATCYLSVRRSDLELLVCKVYPKSPAKKNADLPTEVQILKDHLPPNDRIVRFHEVVLTRGLAHVYLDYYSGGDLENFIYNYRDHETKVPESFIWHAILHLAEALAYIHFGYDRHSNHPTQSNWQTVIHRDIKPSNILLRLPAYDPNSQNLTEYPYPSLVLADFGLASLEETSYYIGSYLWQPPELPEASPAADCWALGACIHAMALEGKPPIGRFSSHLRRTRRNRNLWQTEPAARAPKKISDIYSQELQDCMACAFIVEPSLRHNAGQILGTAINYSERPPWMKTPQEPLAPWAFMERWEL